MTTSLKIISLFLLLVYSSYVFRIIFPLIDYAINYSFIVNELCEQKDDQNNMCMGKCHLQKEIKKSIEHASDESNKIVIINLIDIPHNLISNKFKHFSRISELFYDFNFSGKISNNLEPIIPPPKFKSIVVLKDFI